MPVRVPKDPGALRAASGAHGSFALLALLAVLLDGLAPHLPGALAGVRWIEPFALAGLAAAALAGRGNGAAWSTPLDGRLGAMMAVLLLATLGAPPSAATGTNVRVALAGLATYYALSALVAKDPEAAGTAWRAFPVAAAVLGLHALWAATGGLANLAARAAAVDAAWGTHGALALALAFATLLTLGRALEPGAPPAWRLSAVVGAVGTGLHVAAVGSPFGAHALSRLETPLEFSASVVVALVLHGLGRTAWMLRRERRSEATRWWGVIAANTLLGAWLPFGHGPPGEGLAILAALAAALIAASPALPAARVSAPAAGAPEPLRRAA